jgi:hypothetical protein
MQTVAGLGGVVLAATLQLALSSFDLQERGPVTRHTLWKIEGGRKPVYLLGSIHVLRRQNYPLERPIEDAFDEAKIVAFEIDLDEARAGVARAQPAAATVPKAPPGEPKSLRGQVSRETYRSVVRYLEGQGYPGTVFDGLPASFVAGALVQIEMRQLGFDPDWGVDAYFYRRARKYGKTVVPLETVDEQREAIDGLTHRGNDELVQAALQDVAGLRTMLRDLVRAWKGGEIDKLTMLVNGSFDDRAEVYQNVMVERNARWIPKIEALMAGDVPALVIVGTGHLVGSESVVAMLRAKGYVVTQQ